MLVKQLPQNSIVLLIDADSISYSISHELKKWDDDVEKCDALINDYMTNLLLEVGCTHYVGFLGGKTNFRYQVAKTKAYKANRSELSQRDKNWKQYINEFLIQHWLFQVVEGIEADDAVSIGHEELEKTGINHIICSNDKDVDQVSGNHYSMNKRKFYHINDWEAITKLFFQLIVGDSTDNIPGLKGKGEVFANNYINLLSVRKNIQEVVDVLTSLYPSNQYFQEQLILLGLLTEKDDLVIEYHLIDKQKLEDQKNQLVDQIF